MKKAVKEKIASLIVLSLLLIPTIQLFYTEAHAASGPGPLTSTSFSGAPQVVEHYPGVDDQPSALQLINGSILVAWRTNRAGPTSNIYNIFLKTLNVTSSPPSWLSSVRVTTTDSNSHPSLSQFPNGTIILVWTSNSTGFDNLYYMTNTSGRWSSRVQLTSGAFLDESARIIITPDSTLWAVWERDTPTGLVKPSFYHQIYYKTMSGANSWTSDTALTTNVSIDSIAPSVAVSRHGLLWFTWTRNSTNVYNIVYRTLNGTIWSSDNVLTNTSSNDSYPYMIQDRGGTMWLFWSRAVTSPNVLQYQLFDKSSDDVGKTWSADGKLTTGGTVTDPVLDIEPSAIQGYDNRLWLFYSSNQFLQDFDLYYLNSGSVFPVHHVSVTSIQVSPTKAYPWGDAPQNMVTINVTVSNLGDYDESTLALTAQAVNKTTITIGTSLMGTLLSGETTFVLFSWDTLATHASQGRYTIVASIPRITGTTSETIGNAVDNKLVNTYAEAVLLPGALRKDYCITIIDAGMMGKAFGTTPSSLNWNPDADLATNGIITIIDFGILAAKFGKCV